MARVVTAMDSHLPVIAVFAGPTATILNSPPLITSRKAREKYGVAGEGSAASQHRLDVLRPQRLAAPARLLVRQFSAHPLEADAASLYAPPDGYVSEDGAYHPERRSPADVPVYEVELLPEDGLYLLPYMARQRDGEPWESDAASPGAAFSESRQPFFPDASRLFEEIDRFHIGDDGLSGLLSSRARFEFFRPAPSGGYVHGCAEADRTDVGAGDIPPEELGVDFFPYRPRQHRREPPRERLATITNTMQEALASGRYAGGIWLEGSPFVEETAYWLDLLLDIDVPLVCLSGHIGELAHRNVVDAVTYILSRVWTDAGGGDAVGVVGVIDEVILTAREIQKADDRPGGYIATGGHGGVIGTIGKPGPPVLTFIPNRLHTKSSSVKVTLLPDSVPGRPASGERKDVAVMTRTGELSPSAIPTVSILKHARYASGIEGSAGDVDATVLERLAADAPLAGFVAEGGTPYGHVGPALDAAIKDAALRGMPTVKVSRGNADGFLPASRVDMAIAGGNLTATKARMLLMACLLRFGALPRVEDPSSPTDGELDAVKAHLQLFQQVFDTH